MGPGWFDHAGAAARLEEQRRRRRRRTRLVLGLSSFAIVVVVATGVALVAVLSPATLDVRAHPDVSIGSMLPGARPGGSGSTTRVRPALDVPPDAGEHTFIQTESDGDPVAWDPCEPIRYVVNPDGAPPGGAGIIDDAVAEVERATGLDLQDVGTTVEAPPVGDADRAAQDDRYGDDWSPVLIAWTDVDTDPSLAGYAGIASTMSIPYGGGESVYVTGMVRLLGDHAADLVAAGRESDVLSIAMHELGHLVGLDHVDATDEVMTDDPSSLPTTWGAGDRHGLALLGVGDCAPNV